MSKKFYICCRLGCPRRSLDTSTIYNYFLKNKWKPGSMANSDIILIYSCGGFNTSEKRCLKTIRKALDKKKENARVIVTGCLLNINKPNIKGIKQIEIEDLSALDDIIGAKHCFSDEKDANVVKCINDLERLSPLYKRGLDQFSLNVNFFKKVYRYIKRKLLCINRSKGIFNKKIYNIKISQGCMGNCSYCAIKISNGPLKSKPLNDIINEFRTGLQKGYKSFVLIAEDTGCYGQDIGYNIVDLLRGLFSIKGDYKIIMNDFNPKWFIKYKKELVPLIAQNTNRIKDLRLPIQSGSNRILKLMKRGYKIEEIKNLLNLLKEKVPDLSIQTHIMVGFPGETKSDFMESWKLVKKYDFAQVDEYIFEGRKGTKAFNLPNKVSKKEKIKRSKKLLDF